MHTSKFSSEYCFVRGKDCIEPKVAGKFDWEEDTKPGVIPYSLRDTPSIWDDETTPGIHRDAIKYFKSELKHSEGELQTLLNNLETVNFDRGLLVSEISNQENKVEKLEEYLNSLINV